MPLRRSIAEALPKVTSSPNGCRESSEPAKVDFPTESYTTGTPFPPVSAFTRSGTLSRSYRMTWSAPCAFASAAFSSEPAVPITVAPSAFSHWHAMSPTPPAAAWKSTVSPGFTR